MDWKEYCNRSKWHPDANLFPCMGTEELESLAQDIKQNGLQEPIRLFEGKVLDGRNRVLACAKANVEPRFVQWHKNGVSSLAFVVSENLERRHLSTSQRAALAAQLRPQFAKEAQERQKAAGKYGAAGGRGNKTSKPSAQKCAEGSGKSSEQAASRFGVSARSVEKATALAKQNRSILGKVVRGELTLQQADKAINSRGKLADQFVAPPFTVLDAKQGYWQERKRWWKEKGVHGGHNEQLNSSLPEADGFENNSAFGPVLAECIYGWFTPSGGKVLDPFAGEAIKGLVAAKLGYDYTGIDTRAEQVEENAKQASRIRLSPTWIHGNSIHMKRYIKANAEFDLIFTSPPYYDLESYSEQKEDISTPKEPYEKFLDKYERIFRQAVARLKPNRFVVVKIGDVRDEKGFFRNLPGDSISRLLGMGLKLYNSAILVTPIGTLPMRTRPFRQSRKLGSAHQHVQCFFKGDPKRIPIELGVLKGKE